MNAPCFSVVICAYTPDRWHDILAAVDSVQRQTYPALETLLVVDHHEELRKRLADQYADDPKVWVFANAGPRGLSSGRNTGIAAALGDTLAFLDDDATADPDWLRWFAEALADPSVLAVGGRAAPRWPTGQRPRWFPPEFDWTVGCGYRGMPSGRVRNVHGGNAAFRRSVFEHAGGFARGIGRDGTRLPLGGEETELCIRLRQTHEQAVIMLEHRAVTGHRVPPERARPSYLRTRCYAEGLSKALITQRVGSRVALATERSYTTSTLPSGLAGALRDFVLARPGGGGRALAIVTGAGAATAGYLVGLLRPRRARPELVVDWPLARTAEL